MSDVIRVWRLDDSRVWRMWSWTVDSRGFILGCTWTRRGAVREARRYLRGKARAAAAGPPTVYTYSYGEVAGDE